MYARSPELLSAPIDDAAAAFYKHHDFVALSEERRHFVLPLLWRTREMTVSRAVDGLRVM
jgi:hypothetical protein